MSALVLADQAPLHPARRTDEPAITAPPRARPGLSSLPLVGRVLAGIATALGPLEHALLCRQKAGDVFTVDLPASPPMTYLLGLSGYRFMNSLPAEVAGIGGILSIVPVLSSWVSRSDVSEEHLEKLAIGGRAFLQHRLRRPEAGPGLRGIVEEVVEEATRSWAGEIDLTRELIALTHSLSVRLIGGDAVWSRLQGQGLLLLRAMASGVDVPRLALGATPLRRWMSDYRAARRFEGMLRDLIEEHREKGGIELIDDLRANMRVGDAPLDERDLAWALHYVLFNSVAYPGTYGFWSFVDIVTDAGTLRAVSAGPHEEALRRAEHALLETIRLHPVTVAGRVLRRDVSYSPSGCPFSRVYNIAAGTRLGSAPGSFARDPSVYRDPGSYCPERYAQGEPIPQLFGGGPFGCVAQRYVRALIPCLHMALLRRLSFEVRGPLPPRKARPALHYPRRPVLASVSRLPAAP